MKDQDNGVRYLIHRKGTPQFRNDGGVIAPSGEWWNGGEWGGIDDAVAVVRLNGSVLPDGGEWVAVFLNVSVNGEVG